MAGFLQKKAKGQFQRKTHLSKIILTILILPISVHAGGNLIEPVQKKQQGVQWSKLFQQSALLLGVQTGVRIIVEPETRQEMDGPFFKDWLESVRGLHGWDDGDPFAINYLGHPYNGAVSGFIFVQNDPVGRSLDFQNSKPYWKSRLKALGWSAVHSAVFELSPVGEAGIGNVGGAPWPNGMTYGDLVITPVLGTGYLVIEDIFDRYPIQWVERRSGNIYLRSALRTFLNPARSVANLLRFKWPWHRDTRTTLPRE